MAKELTQMVKTRVSESAKEQLEAIAAKKELTVSDVVREAIRDFVDTQPAAKKGAK